MKSTIPSNLEYFSTAAERHSLAPSRAWRARLVLVLGSRKHLQELISARRDDCAARAVDDIHRSPFVEHEKWMQSKTNMHHLLATKDETMPDLAMCARPLFGGKEGSMTGVILKSGGKGGNKSR